MATKTYRVRVERGGVQFEAEGDKAFVLQMLARFEAPARVEEDRAAAGGLRRQRVDTASRLAAARGTSPGEFIRQFHLKKHTDFVLAFAYYLEKHSGLTAFAAADINNCYYEAKMESSNTSQMIIQNIKRGYLVEAKGAGKDKGPGKLYTLTHSGLEYLQKALAASSEE